MNSSPVLTCPRCQLKCLSMGGLKTHLRAHTRPYTGKYCAVCGKPSGARTTCSLSCRSFYAREIKPKPTRSGWVTKDYRTKKAEREFIDTLEPEAIRIKRKG